VRDTVAKLAPTGTPFQIPGTYSDWDLRNTYSAGIEHVQGVSKIAPNRYVVSHNTRAGKVGGLFVVGDGKGGSKFHVVGRDGHPGAIQSCGMITIVPGDDVNTIFVDENGRVLPPSIEQKSGAAGLVYNHVDKSHYALLQGGHLYKSNGVSLRSLKCTFNYLGKIANVNTPQGGTQLLCDSAGALYAVALDRFKGHDYMNVYSISVSSKAGSLVTQLDLGTYVGSEDLDYGPSFRWAGGVYVTSGSSLEVFQVARLLATNPSVPSLSAKLWVTR
jgi:hypothetical protein